MAGLLDDLWPALIQQESGGNPNAVSPRGALGTAQTMPTTLTNPGFGVTPWNGTPDDMERVGHDYFGALLNNYGNDPVEALAAYNWGPGHVNSWIKNGANFSALPGETQNYVKSILGNAGATTVADNNTDSQNNMGLLGNFDKSMIGPSLLALAAGIGSGKNIGEGLGQGFGNINTLMQNQFRNRLLQQGLQLQRYEIGRGPNGQSVIIDKLHPTASGMLPTQNFGQPQQPSSPQTTASNAPTATNPVEAGLDPDLVAAAKQPFSDQSLGTNTGVQSAGSLTAALPEAQRAADKATQAQSDLKLLKGDLDILPPTGVLSPGYGTETAAEYARGVNKAAAIANLPPKFDPQVIAALEESKKLTTKLGFENVNKNFGGSKESGAVVQLGVKTQPGQEISLAGNRRIAAHLDSAYQRDIDRNNFLQIWSANHPSLRGADAAFEQVRPIQYYLDRANKSLQDYTPNGQSISKAQTAPADPSDRLKGSPYMTPKGPFIWTGRGWQSPVQASQ